MYSGKYDRSSYGVRRSPLQLAVQHVEAALVFSRVSVFSLIQLWCPNSGLITPGILFSKKR